MVRKVKIKGRFYEIKKSDKPDKQLMVKVNDKWVYFGDPNMAEYPGTKRGDNYCARSLGIATKYGVGADLNSPNFWSREVLWSCLGNKSKKDKYPALRKL